MIRHSAVRTAAMIGVAGLTILGGAAMAETFESPFAIRGWILLKNDMDHLRAMIRRAPAYGINHVQLSHDVVHHADEVLTDEGRRRDVDELATLAHENGLECYVWTHEIRQPDPSMMKDGRVVVDPETFWSWIRDRYERFYDACPAVDGLVISFSEGDYRIDSSAEVESSLPVEEMFRRLIGTVHGVCRDRGKTLVVRKFSEDALRPILEAPDDLVIMQKCTVSDWQVYSANNPNLGTYGANHRQICEFDLAGEYVGQCELPWCAPAYIQSRFRYAVERGCVGMAARIDRGDRTAFGTPNEINVDVFTELLRDPAIDVDAFWEAWCRRRFGADGAAKAEAALRPTFELTTRLYWGDRLGDWRIQEHGRIPRLEYAVSHDRDYMFSPPVDVDLFSIPGRVEREMDRRYGVLARDVDRVIARFDGGADQLAAEDAAWIRRYLIRLRIGVDAFRAAHTAFIRYRVTKTAGATPERTAALQAAIDDLQSCADTVEREIRPPLDMFNATRLRTLADAIETGTGTSGASP